jgi:hypothetical protein
MLSKIRLCTKHPLKLFPCRMWDEGRRASYGNMTCPWGSHCREKLTTCTSQATEKPARSRDQYCTMVGSSLMGFRCMPSTTAAGASSSATVAPRCESLGNSLKRGELFFRRNPFSLILQPHIRITAKKNSCNLVFQAPKVLLVFPSDFVGLHM